MSGRPRLRYSLACLVGVGAWWAATAWLARRPAPWAIELTNSAFAVGLACLYAGAWTIAAVWSRDRRAVLFRAAAITISLAVGVLIVEAPAVAGAIDYSRIRGALTGNWNGPAADFVDDHDFSFRRPPRARWSGRPRSDMAQHFNLPVRASYELTFSTDSRGFRNRTDLDRADVALLGDSYIEGAYVSDSETAAVRLQEITGRPVANLGVSGYGSLQELKVIEKFALPLGPRMAAWFFFEGNDLDDDQIFENAMAYERGVPAPPQPPALRWRGFLHRSFAMNVFLQLREMADALVPNAADSFGWFTDRLGETHRLYFYDFYATRELGPYERERFETTKATFRKGQEICRRHGIRLVVFYIPMKFRVYASFCTFPSGSPCLTWRPWNLEAEFAAFCRTAGIEFVSLTESMRQAAASGEVLYVPEDSHWNAAGQAFVAGQVQAAWSAASR